MALGHLFPSMIGNDVSGTSGRVWEGAYLESLLRPKLIDG